MVDATVVVPAYNDPEGLRVTLQSLVGQRFDDYEVIVADNGSNDGTQAVARTFAANHTTVRLVIEDEIQSSYAARNQGIRNARGSIICFLDADMWVNCDYIGAIWESMDTDAYSYMGCRVELVTDGSTISRYNASTGFPVGRYLEEEQYVPTCCLAVDASVFEDVGLFDHRMISSGDVEFGKRVHDAGFGQSYNPDIVTYHPARGNISDLISKQIRIGRGKEQMRQLHGSRIDGEFDVGFRDFLPVHPVGLRRNFTAEPRSNGEFWTWYIVACVLKWANAYGRIKERAVKRRGKPFRT